MAKPSNINGVEWINAIMCYLFIYKITKGKFEYNGHSQQNFVINLLFSPHVYIVINIVWHLCHEPIMKKKPSLMFLEVLILLHFHFWVGLYVHNTYGLFWLMSILTNLSNACTRYVHFVFVCSIKVG